MDGVGNSVGVGSVDGACEPVQTSLGYAVAKEPVCLVLGQVDNGAGSTAQGDEDELGRFVKEGGPWKPGREQR